VFVSGSFRLDLGRIEIKNWKLEFNVNIKLQISVNPKRHPEFNPRAEKLEARSLNREVFWSLKSFNCKQEHMQKRFNGVWRFWFCPLECFPNGSWNPSPHASEWVCILLGIDGPWFRRSPNQNYCRVTSFYKPDFKPELGTKSIPNINQNGTTKVYKMCFWEQPSYSKPEALNHTTLNLKHAPQTLKA